MAANNRPKENVWDYPRPPALEPSPLELKVIWTDSEGKETIIASTRDGYRVLETSHPPTYYIPPKDVNVALLEKTNKSSFCEWKGQASYFNFLPPSSASTPSPSKVQNRIWSYPAPSRGTKFDPTIKDYFSFYASSKSSATAKDGSGGEWRCFVDGEQVQAQDGDFYGGWITSELEGKMKGGPGTRFW
ncbi:DUF427-domain-containing protein [Meredithblackwellia eburnea MCA 4105]